MAFIVETKKYAQAKSIAENLEDAFLTTKFSDDNQIKQIAKSALLQKEIKFAQGLNKALRILGTDSKDIILIKLSEEFPDFTYRAYKEFKCDNLISEKHPQKVKERNVEREEWREKSKNLWKNIEEMREREEEQRRQEKSFTKDVIFYLALPVLIIFIAVIIKQ